MGKTILKIKGMHCNSCAKLIENLLEEKGVIAIIDFESGKAKIAYDKEKINIDEIRDIIKKENYEVS